MNIEFKIYDFLPESAIQIRQAVFVKEQGFVNEFDEVDHISTHLVVFDGVTPIATCRYYWNDSKNSYVVGRIAVDIKHRGKNIGSLILQETEKQVRNLTGNGIYLMAQTRAVKFYEKQGYCPVGEPCDDEGCPHIWLYKKITEV